MLQLTEDFVTYEDGILNIKTSQTLSGNSSEECQTETNLPIPYPLASFKFILTGNCILGNLS